MNWHGLNEWQQWALAIGGSLVAALIGWSYTRLFGRRKKGENVAPVQQNASPTMTQNFQPTINFHLTPAVAPVIEHRESVQPILVHEDGVMWGNLDGKRTGPYCPTCFQADGKTIYLIQGATPGTYTCPLHRSGFLTEEARKRLNR